MHRIHAFRQRKAHAFQHRARQFRPAVLVRQAKESPLCLRIIVRRALAGKIRQKPYRRGLRAGAFSFGQQVRHIIAAGQRSGPVQTGGGTQHHRHQMPALRQRMTETVHGALRIAEIAFAHQKIDARGAERQHALSWLNHANADSASRIVAAAGHQRHRLHPPARRNFRQQRAGNLVALKQLRHVAAVQPARCQHCIAPVALCHIQPHRSRRI